MTMTDPIADMLTRVRNANSVKHDTVDVPASSIKKELARILLEEGFVRGYDVIEDGKQGIIRIQLKYGQEGERVISGLKRISKPGMRIYANSEELPKVLNGLGIAVISTSHGILTDKQARQKNVGGEVICYVW
ncbi:MAG: 30S ribosomal protein S8 [Peptostreptococcus russellii]|jgi:small subunit ribosomal protein S8|uniref:Small ribosomal subunit protein uS8 n=1 Tax=Peptostreptococcus russellii TaxID=215200 RepID=A0A2P7PZW0_9FIRM|nr:30S ribosomal protein S8 [Peptostreptococcus russellii]PSJ31257.1 30S ribosomal protein S8 [Peptostreptococcus russellii]